MLCVFSNNLIILINKSYNFKAELKTSYIYTNNVPFRDFIYYGMRKQILIGLILPKTNDIVYRAVVWRLKCIERSNFNLAH